MVLQGGQLGSIYCNLGIPESKRQKEGIRIWLPVHCLSAQPTGNCTVTEMRQPNAC